MKRLLLFLGAICALGCTDTSNYSSEDRINEILGKMTLEEKIGQMTQLTLDAITTGGSTSSTIPHVFDQAVLDSVFDVYKIGSILNTPASVPQTPEQWYDIVKLIQDRSIAATGIPSIYGLDQIHGTTYTLGGTMFPQEIAQGATFNPELVEKAAMITAYETKAGSVPWNFSPVLDLGRDPRWPRHWETYGEDSHLASVMGVAAVKGYQGENRDSIPKGRVAACLKHFLGYSAPLSGKDRTPSYVNDNDMRERYFAPFKAAIEAGALSVMVNSATNNGIPVHMNAKYLTEWLKNELNWDGLIVTDWADINNIYSRDKIASSKKEAIALAINAGIDMSMVPYDWSFCNDLRELVEEGKVPMSRIDDAARRVLRLKIRLGLFENPYYNVADFTEFSSAEHHEASENAALEAITLLKNNNNILPLDKEKRVLVTGPNANTLRAINGGWTLSWQGNNADKYGEQPGSTFREALVEYLGENKVVYSPGVEYDENGHWASELDPRIEEAVAAAYSVDYILAFVGENSYAETPGNLDDLTMSENQRNLVKALAKTGKPIILILNEGRPRIINDITPLAEGIFQTYLPGSFGGTALAKLLYGEVNPSGKLPYTYPKYVNSLTTYDHKPSESTDVMEGAYNYDAVVSSEWAFGYGLSYTTFKYSDLKADKTEFNANDKLSFTVKVANTGERFGKESVLLFSSDHFASMTPDVRRLRAFRKIELQPYCNEEVVLTIDASDLAFVGADGKWRLEEGDFTIQIGTEVVDIHCTETKVWETPNI